MATKKTIEPATFGQPVTLAGCVSSEPNTWYTSDGIATTEFLIDVNAEEEYITEEYVITRGDVAEFVGRYITQGNFVRVEGQRFTGRLPACKGFSCRNCGIVADKVEILEEQNGNEESKD